MGKVRHRRKQGARYTPIGTQTNGTSVSEHNVEPLPTSIQFSSTAGLKCVEEKISSIEMEERLVALNSLAAMALQDGAPEVIGQSKVIPKALPCLTDQNLQVRLATVGALRNICAGGSNEVVEKVVSFGILVPLAKLVNECHSHCHNPQINNNEPCPEASDDPELLWNQILIHSMNVMWNLCECCDAAVDIFNEHKLIQVILSHIDPRWGSPLAMACADCLLCVSEDNIGLEEVKEAILTAITRIIKGVQGEPQNLKYLITLAGVLGNLGDSSDSTQIVLQTISNVLDINDYSLNTSNNSSIQGYNFDILSGVISAQQLALEIFSNFACSEDWEDKTNDSDSWDDITDGDMDEEQTMDETEEPMDVVNCDPDISNISTEAEECIKQLDLVGKTLTKIVVPNEAIIKELSAKEHGDEILLKLGTLRMRALVCLQNLLACLDLSILGGGQLLYETWVHLGQLLCTVDITDTHLLESSTGALRAIIEKLCNSNNIQYLSNITQDELKILFEIGLSCKMPNVRANLARTVGSIARVLVKSNTSDNLCSANSVTEQILQCISEYLFKVAEQDDELWVSAEAIDVIIDIYSDDKTDQIAANISFTDKMKGIKGSFISKYRSKRKTKNGGVHDALINTVRDNLQAFIKYKNNRVAKLLKEKLPKQ